jgi:hypothetical protein
MMVESWAQWLRRNNPLSLRGTAGAKAPESPGRNGASITPRGPLARWAVAPRARRPRGAWSEMADWPDAGLSRHDRPAARCWVEPDGTCRIARYEPERIEVDVTLDRPGRLVLAEQHYPGWSAWLDSAAGRRMLDVRAERGVFRAVDLPAGEHRVVFRYRPRSVLIGAIIRAVAWLGAIGAMVVLAARRRA